MPISSSIVYSIRFAVALAVTLAVTLYFIKKQSLYMYIQIWTDLLP